MKPRSKIDYTDFHQVRRLALWYAHAHGLWNRELAEDFAQEYCIVVWQKKYRYRDLRIHFTDFLRKYYGRTKGGTKTSNAKALAIRTMREYKEW